MNALLAGAGGVIGAFVRFGALGLPLGTWGLLAVNALGSLALGALLGRGGSERQNAFWGSGVLGGFTTFSGATRDAATRFAEQPLAALAYLAGMAIACVACAMTGRSLAQKAGRR